MQRGIFERDFESLFNPRSIAVVGASNAPGKWGFMVPMNILGGGYRGKLFMVNPGEKGVLGLPTFARLADIGDQLDLVILTIPARSVAGVLREAAELRVRNAVVVASNFGEVGGEGADLEREVAAVANEAGITIVGPNTMGIYSSTSSLSALGAPVFPLEGQVGFISQSGNLGVQLLSWGRRRGIGFSRFVGSGNAANTEISDYLSFLGDDPCTGIILLYIEGITDGRRLLEVARRITPHKPIVALKAGRGLQGQRAARSHSGALAGSFDLFKGMFEQAGILLAESTEELVDLAAALSSLPLPGGDRVAVMTMGGGWGVAAADACDREGLELASLPQPLVEELDELLPSFWSRRNPVDIVGNVKRSNHFRVLESLTRSKDVDMVIAMGTLLGKGFFADNLLNTAVRPVYYLARLRSRRLLSFVIAIWRGFFKSWSGGGERNPEGSGGIDPSEISEWTDSALVKRMTTLMDEEKKPIVAVSVNEEESAFLRLRGTRLYVASSPERAIRVAGKMVAYSRFVASVGGDGGNRGGTP
jgi:acyl-CoA synthetase (NDP forming)